MQIQVGARFNGPPGCGNGGYTCGLIASTLLDHTHERVKVRLTRPVPIETTLRIESNAAGTWDVFARDELIASATPDSLIIDVPAAPSWIEAFGVSRHFAGFAHHNFPNCFVCGPARASGDGLRIFAAAVPGTGVLAAPWRPDASLADGEGYVRPEFIWAALDCPGFYATCEPRVALLGELSARIDRPVRADDAHVVTAWKISSSGRKHIAGTALFDAAGECCAVAQATWIELKQ